MIFERRLQVILKGLQGMIKSAGEGIGWYKEIIPDVEYSAIQFYLTNLSWILYGTSEMFIMWQSTKDINWTLIYYKPLPYSFPDILKARIGPEK